jgi:hypothetical protein
MKKQILVIALLFIGYSIKSQILISLIFGDKLNSPNVEFGLDGGVNFGNIAHLDPSKYLPLFNIGFYFDIRLKGPLLLHTGVIVKSNQGAGSLDPYLLNNTSLDTVFADGIIDRKITNFSVPILLKYRFATFFHVEAGPMLALRTKAYDEFKNSIKEDNDLSYKLDVKDNYKRIDAGIMVGVGAKLSRLPKSSQTGIRFYYGLVDPLKENAGKPQYFSSIYLYFSLPIGANPKPKPEKSSEK